MVGPGRVCPPHVTKPRSHHGAGLRRIPEGGDALRPAANLDAKLTARELGLALGVTPQLVNRWHTDGYLDRDGERVWLPEAGRNWRGHRLFRYLDGAKAEAATRRSPKSFRSGSRDTSGWAELDRKPVTDLARTS